VVEQDDYGEYAMADEAPPGCGDRVLDALRALGSASAIVDRLRSSFLALVTLLGECKADGNATSLVDAVLKRAREVRNELVELHTLLYRSPYPYDHADGGVSIARFLIRQMPPQEQVGAIAETA